MTITARVFLVTAAVWIAFIWWIWAFGGRQGQVDQLMMWVGAIPIIVVGAFVWAFKGFSRR